MPDARDAVIADVRRLMDSGQELRRQILESRKGFTRGLTLLERGVPLSDALAELNTAERRLRMTDCWPSSTSAAIGYGSPSPPPASTRA